MLDEYDAIRNEIFLFDSEVGEKPELVALNKVDVSDEAAERALTLQRLFKEERNVDAHVISALEGQGVKELVDAVKARGRRCRRPTTRQGGGGNRRGASVARPADGKSLDDFTIKDTPYAFIVEGAALELVQMTNWDYFESFKRFARVLTMSGVEKALNEAGGARATAWSSGSTSSSGPGTGARSRCSTPGRRSRMRSPRAPRCRARDTAPH